MDFLTRMEISAEAEGEGEFRKGLGGRRCSLNRKVLKSISKIGRDSHVLVLGSSFH